MAGRGGFCRLALIFYPMKKSENTPLRSVSNKCYNMGVVRERVSCGRKKGNGAMNEKLNLENGDKAYLCVAYYAPKKKDGAIVYAGYKCKEVTVAVKRNLKNGVATYFIDENGARLEASFDALGFRNFKDWRAAAWCMRPQRLFDNARAANRFCREMGKEAA